MEPGSGGPGGEGQGAPAGAVAAGPSLPESQWGHYPAAATDASEALAASSLRQGTTPSRARRRLPVLAHPPSLLCAENSFCLPRPHGGSPSWLEPISVWASPGAARVNALSVGSIRWIYPLDYPLTDGSPRSVSRTRCLHPLVEVAWTEVLLLSGSHSLPTPPAARLGSLPLPSRSTTAPPAPRAIAGPRALSSPVSV